MRNKLSLCIFVSAFLSAFLGPHAGAGRGTDCPPPPNAPPTASSVSILGTPQVGQVLTGSYNYGDTDNPEGVATSAGCGVARPSPVPRRGPTPWWRRMRGR